jgi:hypothetical protein
MTTPKSRPAAVGTPDRDRARNNSSRYPTIGRSEASDAQTPSVGLIQNLNLEFYAIRVPAIMDTIQRMAPDGSPLTLLSSDLLRSRLSFSQNFLTPHA